MKYLFLVVWLSVTVEMIASDSIRIEELQKSVSVVQKKCDALQQENVRLKQNQQLFQVKWDSLQRIVCKNERRSLQSMNDLEKEIKMIQTVTDKNKDELSDSMQSRTIGGLICALVLLLILIVVYCILHKRMKRGSSVIDKIKDTQKTLQEESIKLDNKLLEVVEKQIETASALSIPNKSEIDHSLALKVADEIVRIEINLSRMDPSIRGYKQLSKAVQRIKDNFYANGYEIVDMLGKQYVTGMKAAVTFITDENLKKGQQIVTKIIKPQINYQQQMIQAAQIEVSQSE